MAAVVDLAHRPFAAVEGEVLQKGEGAARLGALEHETGSD
jgi:hypothetical protein